MRKIIALLVAGLATLLLAPVTALAQSTPVPDELNLEFSGLEPLGSGAVYEGWLIIGGAAVSSGTFDIDANGDVVNAQDVTVPNADTATAFVLTIEPAVDPDPAPSSTHVLAGNFAGGTAPLTIDHPAALGTDFATAAGGYIIATPTAANTSDPLSGVWFLDPAAGPGPSLTLPTLPAGWEYEGWVVLNGSPVSTGRFTSAAGADDFSGFSGPNPGPPFPGEDFLVNAPAGLTFPTDLSGATVVISVEPEPDDGPAPFALKPLVGSVPGNVAPGVLQTLGAGPVAITGTASFVPAATCNGLAVTIDLNTNGGDGMGTTGDDVILGTPGDDVITALEGNDTVCAGDGDDIVRGNAGVDVIHGGNGDDRLLGGIDGDTLIGGDGDDFLGGFGGADTINGDAGNDTIFGGFGADTIDGGDDNDTINGLVGNDIINGGDGDDTLNGDRGNDTINGGAGNDTIRGGNADDILDGGDGDDTVTGGKADDTVSGGDGIDICAGNTSHNADSVDASSCETIL